MGLDFRTIIRIAKGFVVGLIICQTEIALSQNETGAGAKTPSQGQPVPYAVFVASYNSPQEGGAVGGVAGTAFFISANRALTAFHVLQSKSFLPRPGFKKVKVWLVRQGRPAIEISSTNLIERKDSDMTLIDFADRQVVGSEEIFTLASTPSLPLATSSRLAVETDGYLANSQGPTLGWVGSELRILEVPSLQRIHRQGEVLQAVRVDLQANDVNLSHIACLQASFGPVIGLSGGPLLFRGEVVGMNSFADPEQHQTTWAIDLRPTLFN